MLNSQPVVMLINLKLAVPAPTPVTTPLLPTGATNSLVVVQMPPTVGDNCVVLPTQITDGQTRATNGLG